MLRIALSALSGSLFALTITAGPAQAQNRVLVVSRIFRTLVWAERPVTGSSCDGSSHLLVLQQSDVQVSLA